MFKIGDAVVGIGRHDSKEIEGLQGVVKSVGPASCSVNFSDGTRWNTPNHKLRLVGGNPMESVLHSMLDDETKLLKKTVLDPSTGNLKINDARVQRALLMTDGFRDNLLTLLKKEQEEIAKK